MAAPKPLSGTRYNLYVGDGATPTEVFTYACFITTFQVTKQVVADQEIVGDCANPTAPAARITIPKYKEFKITGSGVMAVEDAAYQRLRSQYDTMQPLNLRVKIELTGAQGGRTYQGSFYIMKMDESVSDRGTVKVAFEFDNADIIADTLNP